MESWKVAPCSIFKKYGGLNLLLHCNFDETFLKSIEMPSFYKQILSWDQELILFNNKEMQVGGKTVFYQDWFDQGVYSIWNNTQTAVTNMTIKRILENKIH